MGEEESETWRKVVLTMRFVVVLAAAYAQFECDQCDSFPDRLSRTGCRLFCYFDPDGSGVLTRQGLIQTLRRDQDTDNGMSRGRFQELARDRLGFCEDEADDAFDLLASLGESNDELIDEIDLNTLADVFEVLAGTDQLTKELFAEIYDLIYLAIGNDSCNIG